MAKGQDKYPKMLKEAINHFMYSRNAEGLAICEQILKETTPSQAPYFRALYHKADLLYNQKEYAASKVLFLELVNNNLSIKEKEKIDQQGYKYKRYMHNAYSYLMNLAYDDKQYKEALNYCHIAYVKYAFEKQIEDDWIAEYLMVKDYANCYAGVNYLDSSVYVTLPYVWQTTLASQSVKDTLLKIVKTHFTKKETQTLIESFENIKLEKINNQEYQAFIYINQTRIPLVKEKTFIKEALSDKAKHEMLVYYQEMVKKSLFYEKLIHLHTT